MVLACLTAFLVVAAVGDLLTVLVDSVIVEPLLVQLAVPLVPAGRHVARVVLPVLVQVLAEEGGSITGSLQARADRVLLVPLGDERLEPPLRGCVALYAVVMVVETGEDGSPRRATYRVADEGLLKGSTLLS